MFKKNTLTDEEKLKFVNTIALASLDSYFKGNKLPKNREKARLADILFDNLRGDCSAWKKSRLVTLADNVVMSVIKIPALNEFFEPYFIRGIDLDDASKNLTSLTTYCLIKNKQIAHVDYLNEALTETLNHQILNRVDELTILSKDPKIENEGIIDGDGVAQIPAIEAQDLEEDIPILSPKMAYFKYDLLIDWAFRPFKTINKGEIIYRLIDNNCIHEEKASDTCEIVSIEIEQGQTVKQSGLTLGFLNIVAEPEEAKKTNSLENRLSNLKTLFEQGLISVDVYKLKQKDLLNDILK